MEDYYNGKIKLAETNLRLFEVGVEYEINKIIQESVYFTISQIKNLSNKLLLIVEVLVDLECGVENAKKKLQEYLTEKTKDKE
jgi:hypothetical protein